MVARTWGQILATEELPVYGKHEDYTIHPDFPPPFTGHKFYIARWNENIVKVRNRSDFDVSMLSILHQLCMMQLDAEVMEIMIREQGHVLTLTGGREGFRIRRNPLVESLKEVRSKIREFSITLGIIKRPRTVIRGNRGNDAVELDGVDDFDTMEGKTSQEAQGEDFDAD